MDVICHLFVVFVCETKNPFVSTVVHSFLVFCYAHLTFGGGSVYVFLFGIVRREVTKQLLFIFVVVSSIPIFICAQPFSMARKLKFEEQQSDIELNYQLSNTLDKTIQSSHVQLNWDTLRNRTRIDPFLMVSRWHSQVS